MDRIQKDYEKINYAGWVHGQYIIPAIQVALNPKKSKYPDKPHSNKEDTQQFPEIQSRKFEDWANAWNKKFLQKHENGG